MRRPPIINLARKLHARLERAHVAPTHEHSWDFEGEALKDVRRWLDTGDAPRLVKLEVVHIPTEWARRPTASGLYGVGGWRICLAHGDRSLGAAASTMWTAALDGSDLRNRRGEVVA